MRTGAVPALACAVALAGLALVWTPAARAALPAPPVEKSDNVTWLASLEEPQVISARFRVNPDTGKQEMFVSTLKGLAVYDVTNPELPERVGFMPLPHFENEDVDIGGDILLIAHDPSEGKGSLYIVDISDSHNPALLSTFDTGIVDLGFGTGLGPLTYGTGHTASCVQDCNYAYLAGTRFGINIINLTNPAAPVFVRNFAAPEAAGQPTAVATHDIQFDQAGLAWITGFGGTAAYDVSDPENPVAAPVYKTDETGGSSYLANPANDGSTYNDYVHHNSIRIRNSSLAAPPEGESLAADSSVVLVTEEDYNRPTCMGAGSFETWQIGSDNLLHPLDKWDVEVDPSKATLCSAHYFDERAGLVVQGWYEQGTRFFDISVPTDIRQVGYWIPDKNVTWGAVYPPNDASGEIVYSLDEPRGIDVIRISRAGGLPTLERVPPPALSPPASPPPTGGPAASRPDLRISVSDRRRSVRRGARVTHRITVSNVGGAAARDVRVRVRVPRALRYLRGGRIVRRKRQVTFKLASLAPRSKRVLKLVTRVTMRTKARRLRLVVRLTAADDLRTSDNSASDRDRIGRRSAPSRRSGGAAAQNARMSTVVAPFARAAGDTRFAKSLGGLCRLVLDP